MDKVGLLRVVAVGAFAFVLAATACNAQQPDDNGKWAKCLDLDKGIPSPNPGAVLDVEKLPSPGGTLRLHLTAPGIDLKDKKQKFKACIKTAAGYEPVVVRGLKKSEDAGSSNRADAFVVVPMRMRPVFYDDGAIAVLHPDGYFAKADFRLVGAWPAALLALLLVAIAHVVIRRTILRKDGSWLDWFTGSGDKPSLSLFQIYLWTWVIIAGSTFVVILTGDLLAITPQVLALLGVAGVGSVAARLVAVTQDRPPEVVSEPSFTDIFKTGDDFDLYKLQMFLFTVGTAAYVIARILYLQAFPQLEENLLLLLGISNGIYVGSKVASGASPFQLAEQLDVQVKLLEEAKTNADAKARGLQASVTAAQTAVSAAGATVPPQLITDLKLLQGQLAEAQIKLADLQTSLDQKTKERGASISKLK